MVATRRTPVWRAEAIADEEGASSSALNELNRLSKEDGTFKKTAEAKDHAELLGGEAPTPANGGRRRAFCAHRDPGTRRQRQRRRRKLNNKYVCNFFIKKIKTLS